MDCYWQIDSGDLIVMLQQIPLSLSLLLLLLQIIGSWRTLAMEVDLIGFKGIQHKIQKKFINASLLLMVREIGIFLS